MATQVQSTSRLQVSCLGPRATEATQTTSATTTLAFPENDHLTWLEEEATRVADGGGE